MELIGVFQSSYISKEVKLLTVIKKSRVALSELINLL